MEFLQYGLRYVFPISPEAMVTGMPTAHSHPYYKQFFGSEMNYAWPYEEGTIRGLKIEPAHTNVPKAAYSPPSSILCGSYRVFSCSSAKWKTLSLCQRNEMEILVNPQNVQEEKVLLAFLDRLQYDYKLAYDISKPRTVEEYNKEIDTAIANVKSEILLHRMILKKKCSHGKADHYLGRCSKNRTLEMIPVHQT